MPGPSASFTKECMTRVLKGLSTNLPHPADPIEADDWLGTVERELDIAECIEEKILYASGRLQGAALDLVGILPSFPCESEQLTYQKIKEKFK